MFSVLSIIHRVYCYHVWHRFVYVCFIVVCFGHLLHTESLIYIWYTLRCRCEVYVGLINIILHLHVSYFVFITRGTLYIYYMYKKYRWHKYLNIWHVIVQHLEQIMWQTKITKVRRIHDIRLSTDEC